MIGNRALTALVCLLALCVALAATNPTRSQYGRFLEVEVTKALQRMDPSVASDQQKIMREILASQGKKIIESLIQANTIRRNYGLFSVYTTRVFQVEISVVGVCTQFIPLDSRDELVQKLGRLIL
jgi:hypothetical protein